MLDALLEELHDEDGGGYSSAPPTLVALSGGAAQVGEPRNALVAALRAGERNLELRGAALHDADLSGIDFSNADLSGANLARANLSGARFYGARLAGAIMYGACLNDADFTGADLTDANLETAAGTRTGFGGATLVRTKLAEAHFLEAALAEATFEDADLRGTQFTSARGVGARFVRCDATSASFAGGNLRGALVHASSFDHTNLRGTTLTAIAGYETTSWIGSDTRDVPPNGVFMWKRFVTDQNYLAELRNRGRAAEWLYRVWWLTSDCGRSMSRWMLCTLTIIVLFGVAYTLVPVHYGDYATWLSPFYYSVITITSLGYGDVLPASVAAQALAMLEVTTGYLMLGGLLSILSNKMARRGD